MQHKVGGQAAFDSARTVNAGLLPFVSLLSTAGKVGSTINILGQGFTSATKVSFNGVPATSIQVAASTHLVVTVPSGALNGSVTVMTGTTSLVSLQKFSVVPNIASFTPTTGPVESTVVITGSGFRQTTSVMIAGVKTTFIVDSDSQITATVPSDARTGSITVGTPGYTVKTLPSSRCLNCAIRENDESAAGAAANKTAQKIGERVGDERRRRGQLHGRSLAMARFALIHSVEYSPENKAESEGH